MFQITDASFLSIFIVVATMLLTPLYLFATFVFSGASRKIGMWLATGSLFFGAFMFWVCIEGYSSKLGLPGNLIIPAAWVFPSALLILNRKRLFELPLSQHWLVGLQIIRVIGGVFLIEMTRGNVPAIFAWPAGVGDILVGIVAAAVLWRYRADKVIPAKAVYLVLVLGITDFALAFFFGITSSNSPVQLFFPDPSSRLIWFPTGMIPLYLVPYSICFHTLSFLNERSADQSENSTHC